MTRMAISPRLATRTFSNMSGGEVIDAEHNRGVSSRRSWSSPRAAVAHRFAPPAAGAAAVPALRQLRVQCARLTVPLDRSGAMPGRLSLYVEAVRARRRADRGAAAACSPADRGSRPPPPSAATPSPAGLPACRRCRARIVLRPARHRALRPAALPPARAGQPDQTPAPRPATAPAGSARGAASTPPRHRGGHRGAARGARGQPARALRDVLRHVRRPGVRARLPAATSSGWCSTRWSTRPVRDPLYRDIFTAVPAGAAIAVSLALPPLHARPGGRHRAARGRLAEAPLRGRIVGAADGRPRPAADDTRRALLHPRWPAISTRRFARAFPAAVLSALRGRRARRSCGCAAAPSRVEGMPPPPRELSAMLYATTTCEETRLPLDALHAARGAARRSRPPRPRLLPPARASPLRPPTPRSTAT